MGRRLPVFKLAVAVAVRNSNYLHSVVILSEVDPYMDIGY